MLLWMCPTAHISASMLLHHLNILLPCARSCRVCWLRLLMWACSAGLTAHHTLTLYGSALTSHPEHPVTLCLLLLYPLATLSGYRCGLQLHYQFMTHAPVSPIDSCSSVCSCCMHWPHLLLWACSAGPIAYFTLTLYASASTSLPRHPVTLCLRLLHLPATLAAVGVLSRTQSARLAEALAMSMAIPIFSCITN